MTYPGKFELISEMKPAGDQPLAIEAVRARHPGGNKFQTLLGVTGSSKTHHSALDTP